MDTNTCGSGVDAGRLAIHSFNDLPEWICNSLFVKCKIAIHKPTQTHIIQSHEWNEKRMMNIYESTHSHIQCVTTLNHATSAKRLAIVCVSRWSARRLFNVYTCGSHSLWSDNFTNFPIFTFIKPSSSVAATFSHFPLNSNVKLVATMLFDCSYHIIFYLFFHFCLILFDCIVDNVVPGVNIKRIAIHFLCTDSFDTFTHTHTIDKYLWIGRTSLLLQLLAALIHLNVSSIVECQKRSITGAHLNWTAWDATQGRFSFRQSILETTGSQVWSTIYWISVNIPRRRRMTERCGVCVTVRKWEKVIE